MQRAGHAKKLAILIAAIAATGVTSTVLAHKGAKGIVMERMNSMKSMGDGMKSLAAMVTGKAPYNAGKAQSIAATIKMHAADIPKQFPKGSTKGPSEALPNIWTDWDSFIGHAKSLEKLASELEIAADKGKASSLGVFARMGKTCSGCHQDFRKKKKKK